MQTYGRELYDHLPPLRRYARALTGAVEAGDALATRCVEVVVMAPTRFGLDRGEGARLPLYALLHLLFDQSAIQSAAARPAVSPHPIERALATLPECERRLYLLVTLEELSLAEAAQILNLAPLEAIGRLKDARERVRLAMTQRVLVVEDNALQAMEIGEVVADMGHVVCGTAVNEREALSLLRAENPTLALVDVRLADGGSGVEIARHLRRTRSLRTIFITAFDGDLEELDACHLGQIVRKPFTNEAIRAAISRAVFMPRPVALV
ncbi:PhyR family response regulator anti-anti-sigma factor [Azospirillum agricola]|uniref:PhyR family response regulator anti-anti-sigma factor n=1 Tax=Azospirillum agricola TaxID=1720247 RepID=UPI000A0F2E89|nr:response regulator [Azospirillum agricola]SMH59051.1 DNA-binding response regulator, OmpR family, contains REC and winged-helix (wHTH) domain [Azospirillum lipoferum]